MHIIVIEPNRLLARTYQAALEDAGHHVVTCSDAQAAVHAADRQKPNAVILEVQTPRHNGIEFLYEFRSYAEWQDVPVILHTFVPRQHLAAEHFEHLGITGYLYKPTTSLQQLKHAVAEAVPLAA